MNKLEYKFDEILKFQLKSFISKIKSSGGKVSKDDVNNLYKRLYSYNLDGGLELYKLSQVRGNENIIEFISIFGGKDKKYVSFKVVKTDINEVNLIFIEGIRKLKYNLIYNKSEGEFKANEYKIFNMPIGYKDKYGYLVSKYQELNKEGLIYFKGALFKQISNTEKELNKEIIHLNKYISDKDYDNLYQNYYNTFNKPLRTGVFVKVGVVNKEDSKVEVGESFVIGKNLAEWISIK